MWIPAKPHHGSTQPGLLQHPRSAADPERVGICCSGGGLRSAAFSFGAMDVLWREGILQEADYLAGVSGGSYAVTAATIVRAQSEGVTWCKDQPGPYGLGSPELDYMRNRTDYLAPGRMGRWNMFLRMLLGTLLNLAVILGLLFVVGRLAGRVYRWALPELGSCTGQACPDTLKFHGWSAVVILTLLGIGLVAGLLDLLFRPAADWWWRRLVRWTGTFVFLAIIAAVVLRVIPQIIWWARTSRFGYDADASQLARGAGSVAVAAGSLAVSLGHLLFRSGQGGRGSLPRRFATLPRKVRVVVQKLLIGLVVPAALAVFFLVAIDSGTRHWSTAATSWWVAILVVELAIFAFGNPIAWSAQVFYKRRLRTVFALKRQTKDGAVTVGPVAATDESTLSELRPDNWPQLLICAAANVSDLGFTPPGLPVTSFVFSPDRVGGPLVGSMPTAEYERRLTAHPLLPEGLERHAQERALDRSPTRCQSPVRRVDLRRSRVAVDGTHEQTVVPDADRDVEPPPRGVAGQPASRRRARRRGRRTTHLQTTRAADVPVARAHRQEQPPWQVPVHLRRWSLREHGTGSNCCGVDAPPSMRSTLPATRPARSARSGRRQRWRAASSASSSPTSTRRCSR
jgi:hypothetical protein